MSLREKIDLNKPVTFAELPIELHVMASDISNNRLVNFPNDLVGYGYQDIDPKKEDFYMNFSVSQAIRASMSIPLVYQPYILKNPIKDEEFRLDLRKKIETSTAQETELLNKHILSTDVSINEIKNELEGYRKLNLVRNCNTLDFDLTESQKNELHCNGKVAAKEEITKVSKYLKRITESNIGD